MQRDNAQANISNNTISGNSDSVMDQLGTTTALMNTSSNVGSRPVSGSPRTPGSAGRSKPPSAVGGAAGTTGGPGPGASEGVLANFFNSLLSKRTPVVGGVGGIGTSASLSTQGSLDRTSISQKDIQSELKRLAQSSREALDVGDNGPEQLLGDVRQQKLDEMKSVVSSSPKPTKTTSSTNEQPSQCRSVLPPELYRQHAKLQYTDFNDIYDIMSACLSVLSKLCRLTSEKQAQVRSSLLDEVTNKAKVGLSDSKNLVVFGDDQCGKSTLICRLQGNEDKREGFGLEYDIIEVKDEVKDGSYANNIITFNLVSANLSVSVIDGNPIQSCLLKYVMTEDSFNDQMAIIVVSINEPWKIIEALEKWAEILNKHINKLKLSKEMIKACKSRISKEFYGYAEPEASTNDIINPVNLASLSTMYATSQETTPQLSFLNDNESFIEEMYEDNVLNNNLGVPLIVVVTKVNDLMKNIIFKNNS
ncbi:unnamed protein product [Schistosoma mattheei]|uniref:Dynein light intermediate chain n=1 Tax=Schistosoma mattheei TaxID=31246 RepID=A0A183P324_9TREM|nr:unnamed protein product [Schistosoma mattheei]